MSKTIVVFGLGAPSWCVRLGCPDLRARALALCDPSVFYIQKGI